MKVIRIKLYNFSSYLGEYELDLSVSSDKNIILIGGQNGSGKTSLFTAIKLALYGPLAFRFQSKNNHYTMRIKELISHDAYSQSSVNAYIELEIELPQKTGKKAYIIRREWEYTDHRLSERDYVWEDGKLIPDEDFDYFQNYLYSVIPPKMFDFFFFDGEEVAGFFSSNSGNAYIRDAIFTLDSYDNFRYIDRFSKRYVVTDSDSTHFDNLYQEYENVCSILESVDEEKLKSETRIAEINADIEQLNEKLTVIEDKYKKSGGLSKTKRRSYEKELHKWEVIRETNSRELRKYVEDIMPLVLTKSIAFEMQEQMNKEEKMQHYRIFQDSLSVSTLTPLISDILQKHSASDTKSIIEQISETLIFSVKPHIDTDNFTFVHDFSNEQRDSIKYIIEQIAQFDSESTIQLIRAKEEASQEASRIRGILEKSMAEDEVEKYQQNKELIIKEKDKLYSELTKTEEEWINHLKTVEQARSRYKTLRTSLTNLSRRLNAVKFTPLISDMMQKLLQDILCSKRILIEEETLRLSKEILRKEHFIDHIELDDQFNFALYREQTYTYSELSALYHNIGVEELIYRIGSKGVETLLEKNELKSTKELNIFFKRDSGQATVYDNVKYSLYSRIEFNQLSKGEKQIFVLSLYWAIIKSSGKDIPFIIDTPYARIDTEHRELIAAKMFPSISSQVIIFSTDEEITRHYYDAIQPYVSREYTLYYNESEKKSEIRYGYFGEGV